MVTIHQRWEREQKRIAKNDWLTYQLEDLVKLLSQDRKNYLQKEKVLRVTKIILQTGSIY